MKKTCYKSAVFLEFWKHSGKYCWGLVVCLVMKNWIGDTGKGMRSGLNSKVVMCFFSFKCYQVSFCTWHLIEQYVLVIFPEEGGSIRPNLGPRRRTSSIPFLDSRCQEFSKTPYKSLFALEQVIVMIHWGKSNIVKWGVSVYSTNSIKISIFMRLVTRGFLERLIMKRMLVL